MSHFSLLVVLNPDQDIEEHLADVLQPYHEYECTGVDDEYVVDVDITEVVQQEYQKDLTYVALTAPEGEWVSVFDPQFKHRATEREYLEDQARFKDISRAQYEALPLRMRLGRVQMDGWGREASYCRWLYPHGVKQIPTAEAQSFADFAEDWCGVRPNAEGRVLQHTNPNKRWDWWTIGGRWQGAFGPSRDHIKVKELDLGYLLQKARAHRSELWMEAQERLKEHGEQFVQFMYGIEPGTTREQYLDGARALSFFAVLKDGQWYERGRMGWWGAVAEEQDLEAWDAQVNELVRDLDPECTLVNIDCHI